MLNRNDIIFRSLVEQVEYNKDQIEHILQVNSLMAGAGVKLVGNVDAEGDLPATDSYPGNYGDAYLVGTERPYDMYVFTRPTTGEDYPHWFNVGPFPAPSDVPGPQGIQGEQGEQGERGSQWSTGATAPAVGAAKRGDMYLQSNGVVYMFDGLAWNAVTSLVGPTGARGPIGPQGERGEQGFQGPQGVAGDPGDTVKIVGVLTSSNLLPQPVEEDRHHAYLINGHLWIVIGDANLSWIDTGAIGFEIDPNKFVTTDTAQSISGRKTFSAPIRSDKVYSMSLSLPDADSTQFLYADSVNVGAGSSERQLILYSSSRPIKRTGSASEDLAYLSDVQQATEIENLAILHDEVGTTNWGISYVIYGTAGTIVANGTSDGGNSDFRFNVDLSSLPNGTYFLTGFSDKVICYFNSTNGFSRDTVTKTDENEITDAFIRIPMGSTVNNLVIKPMLVRSSTAPSVFKPGNPIGEFVQARKEGLSLSGNTNAANIATDTVVNYARGLHLLRYVGSTVILGDYRAPALIESSIVPQARIGSRLETVATREWVDANVKTLYMHRLTYVSSATSTDLIISLVSSDADAYGSLAAVDKKQILSVQGSIDGDPVVLFYTPDANGVLEVATAYQRFDLSNDLGTGDTVSSLW